jgi:glutathione synthase/RimK-type ligase-like ATP-grasp enzyme
MNKCVFLTLDETGDFVIDDEHAIRPLEMLGWQVSTLSWRQKRIPWSDFDIAIIRSTWDYWNDVPLFLDTLERINRATRLANRLDLVYWNLSKTYMRDLQQQGVGIVPTLFADSLQPDFPARYRRELGVEEIVVKPVVGANGEDAYRVPADLARDQIETIAARFVKRDCMIQPFMTNILAEGEYSLFFFGGEYSHAILKKPAPSEFRSQEEHGAEIFSAVPEAKLLERARQAIDTISPAPLYARIDFIRDAGDDFLVMELEMIEPSMYLRMDPQAPGRFAAAIDAWARSVQQEAPSSR